MNKNRDLIFTFLAVAIMGLLIFLVWKSNQPEPVIIDLAEDPEKAPEHQLVQEALQDVEAFAQAEDNTIQDEQLQNASLETSSVDIQAMVSASVEPKQKRERVSAPSIYDEGVELHPAVRQAIANTAFLAEEQFADPNSTKNLETAGSLRGIREQRH